MKKIKEIAKAIGKYNNFLITSHINPEGDSLGSQLALAGLLRSLGKGFAIVNNNKVPDHYRFLPGADMIQDKVDINGEGFDAAIVLDCPNLKRTGRVKGMVKKAGYIINMDHHVSNENFGDLNWVAKDASSTGEMIYMLYKALGSGITREIALSLYISILTDTGSFNYNNTSSVTHEIISELMGYGIEPYNVAESVYGNKTLRAMKLLGKTLLGLKLAADGKIAYASVRRADFRRTKTAPHDCEDFVNFARSIKGVYVALFFREDTKKRNQFHVSFRSRKKVDVNRVASHFGGGGHAAASGCVLKGSFESVRARVLKRVRDEL
jgi:phosphoesterase RecJ-like protein